MATKGKKDLRQVPIEQVDGMPHSLEAEHTILGAIMLDDRSVARAQQHIDASDFFLDAHRRIFQSMVDMAEAMQPIDIITLSAHLDAKNELAAVGGVSYVSSLIDGVPHQDNIERWAIMVRDKARARKLIHAFGKGQSAILANEPVDDVIGVVESDLMDVLKIGMKETAQSPMALAKMTYGNLMKLRDSKEEVLGLTTGSKLMDELTTGFRDGEYWVLGGRTGAGKSSAALKAALRNSTRGIKTAYFALEMTGESMFGRALSMWSKIPYTRIRDPRFLSMREMETLATFADRIAKSGLVIDDAAGLDVHQLQARIRMQILQGAKLIFVDYLQLVQCREYKDKYDQVTMVSGMLRDLAKTTRVPIVALTQLKRPEGGSEMKPPTLYDLKESGNIENDAFVVWLIHRPRNSEGFYTKEDEYIVAKQRSGVAGWIHQTFQGETLTFTDRIDEPTVIHTERQPVVDFLAKPAEPVQGVLDVQPSESK